MTLDRSAILRVQQHYGELLAGFRRRQAEIAAEQAAKLATCPRPAPDPVEQPDRDPGRDAEPFDDHDFSHNTWLR